MRRSALVLLVAIAAAGCGDDGGEKGGDKPVAAQPVRCTPAPGAGRTVRVEPRWKVGDRRDLTVEKSREEPGRPPRRGISAAQLEVLEAGGGGRSALRFSVDDAAIAVGGNVPQELLRRLREEAKDVNLEYSTDTDGAFASVRNVPEVREQMSSVMDFLEEVAEEEDDDPKAREALKATRRLLESETFIQTTVGEEARLLHAAYGLELEQGESISGEQPLANPFGGEPIAATLRVEVVDRRDRNGCVVIESITEADEKALLRALKGLFDQFGGTAPDPSKIAGASLRHETRYSYDPASGWVVRGEAVKRIEFGGQRRIDRTVVTSAAAR